jgi:hypothetical protein
MEWPDIPYAHLPPEEIGAHQRTGCCDGGNQYNYPARAGKLVKSAAMEHSSPRRQHDQQQLETLGKHLPIETHEEHRCIAGVVASSM